MDPDISAKVQAAIKAGAPPQEAMARGQALQAARIPQNTTPTVPTNNIDHVFTPSVTTQTAQPQSSSSVQGLSDFARMLGFGVVPDIGAGIQNTAKVAAQKLLDIFSPGQKVQNTPNDFVSPQQAQSWQSPMGTATNVAKDVAGAGSWLIPGGEGVSLAGKIIKPLASGAAAGGLNSFANGGNVGDIIAGTAGGALTSGAARAAGGLIKGVAGAVGGIPEAAAANVNKATPSMQAKARDAGLDLNALTQKYFKGGTYEDAIGPADQRNVGGYLGDKINQAEDKLQTFAANQGDKPFMTGQKIISALQTELDGMSNKLGEGDKRAALQKVIDEAKVKYQNGVTVGDALDTLRKVNSEFGKDVTPSGSEAISSSAQILEGNVIRNELKAEFPVIKDALNTQHEIYTLLPSLRGAISKEDSAGLKPSKLDITKPGTLIEPFLNNPEVASTIMHSGFTVPESVGNAANAGLDVFNKSVPIATGGALGGIFSGAANSQQDQTQNPSTNGQFNTPYQQPDNQTNHGQTVSQPTTNVNARGQQSNNPLEGYMIDGQPVSPGMGQMIKNIADYKLDISKISSLRTADRQKLAQLVTQYDPSWDMTQYAAKNALRKDFTSGKSAANIRSLNTAIGHLQSLSDAGGALKNTNSPQINTLKNIFTEKVEGQPQVTRFNDAINAVAGEMATVFKGTSGTDEEIKSWKQQMNAAQSPDQIKEGINQMIELMGSRLSAFDSQWQNGIGKPRDFQLLDNKSRSILQKLGVDTSQIDPSNP